MFDSILYYYRCYTFVLRFLLVLLLLSDFLDLVLDVMLLDLLTVDAFEIHVLFYEGFF
jgi:hypothetical protein